VKLINYALFFIPIFYPSFLKFLPSVQKVIICIQLIFIWGRTSSGDYKIPWVKWGDVCRPKKEGDLWDKRFKGF
jgi:hypothetical protein